MESISELKDKHAVRRGLQSRCPSNWPRVKLGEVCGTINGLWKGTKPPFINVGVIRSTNITKQCEFSIEKTVYVDVEEKKFNARRLVRGDLIVERSGGGPGQPVGRVAYFDVADGKYTVSNFTSILRVHDQCKLSPKFLQKYLTARYVQGDTEAIQSNTTGLHNLDFEAFLNFELPLPPLAVQHEIVARLEKDLAMVERMAKGFAALKAEADQLFKSTLKETFEEVAASGVDVKRLGDVFNVVSARRVHKAEWKKSGIPFYRTREIVKLSDSGSVDNELFISEQLYECFCQASGIPKPGDLMVTAVGTVGRVYVVKARDQFYYKDASVLCFENRNGVDSAFAKYYIESPMMHDVIHEKSKGATVDTITIERANEYPFPLPSLPTQRRIVAKLDAVRERCEKLKRAAEEGLQTTALMRKAILKEAFA